MQRLLLLGAISLSSMAASTPHVEITSVTPPTGTVYLGEEFRIKMRVGYKKLKGWQGWSYPSGVRLELLTNYCSFLFFSEINQADSGECYLNIVIPGYQLNQTIQGHVAYFLTGWGRDHWSIQRAQFFKVTVIPHPLSMANIPIQDATANTYFQLPLSHYVNYYGENLQANYLPSIDVTPREQDGLEFDVKNLILRGRPVHTGQYFFQVGAHSGFGQVAAPVQLSINVQVNQKDRPIFKTHYTIPAGIRGQNYRLNLMELIEAQPSFTSSNNVSFRIDQDEAHPSWLRIGGDNNKELIGEVPANEVSESLPLTLIASSNTGGDSEPLCLTIPLVADPTKRPVIEAFKLNNFAGMKLSYDIATHIKDPLNDANLQVLIDKVVPAAPWLQVSPLQPTLLEGAVPLDASGMRYLLTLRAITAEGGPSEPLTVPLNIAIDEAKTPRFKVPRPQLPILLPGQAFFYDFVENRDIYPEYEDTPYVIEFAEDHAHPAWLKLENNQLKAEQVPEDVCGDVKINVKINNIPGGVSKVTALYLSAMAYKD